LSQEDTNDVTMKLPVRLIPRKGRQIALIVFFTFFAGFAVFWMVMASMPIWKAGNGIGMSWFALFGLPFLAIGILGIVRSVLSMLPNSPYCHLVLAADGITDHSLLKTKRFAWNALSRFSAYKEVSVSSNRKGRRRTGISYWTIAVAADDATGNEDERFRGAVLKIDASTYGGDDNQTTATALADWLNNLRHAALERQPLLETAVPQDFRACATAHALDAAQALSARTKKIQAPRSSVVERQ
jgi:hypothetical protein